jgi:hypothetical protein
MFGGLSFKNLDDVGKLVCGFYGRFGTIQLETKPHLGWVQAKLISVVLLRIQLLYRENP